MSDLPRILVFDVETKRGFQDTNKISEMGISVAVSYDFATDKYNFYTEENIDELINEIFNADQVIGFNIIHFDYEVLKGYTDKDFLTVKTLDIMRVAHKQLGFRPKLDNLLNATLGSAKSSNGLQALIWYRQGKINEIKEYCKQDVRLTKELYVFGRENGYIYANNYDNRIKIPVEWQFQTDHIHQQRLF